MISKKGWFFDIEILEVCGQVNCEKYSQRGSSKRIDTLNIENQIITEPNTRALMFYSGRQEKYRIKKNMREEKKNTLPHQRNQKWKNIKILKVDKLLQYIQTEWISLCRIKTSQW